MKIRLMGLYEEIAQALNALNAIPGLDLLEINGPYPNRGASSLVRVYVEVRFTERDDTATYDTSNFPGSREKPVARPVRVKKIGRNT
jgi:hypothetical protein